MLRVVVTLNQVGLTLWRWDAFVTPVAAAATLVVLVGWTAFATWAYAAARRRTPLLLGADLAVTVLLLGGSPLLKGEGFNATATGFWTMLALLAWAVHWHVRGGLGAAVVLSAVDLLSRDQWTQTTYANVFLLMIGGPVVGYMCASLQDLAVERDAAERAAAAAAERARLGRVVHDGVLQVLALTRRRAAEQGMADLAALAEEQERSLRSLISEQDTLTDRPGRDLAGALTRLGAESTLRVEVATPGGPVPVPARTADEVVAAVAACLDNVARHVGEDARAWVLLEAGAEEVVVSVRDEGPGIPEGRLAEAAAQGRLGVSGSVVGRMRDLGGSAVPTTGRFGTEWELRAPREGTA